MAEQKNRRIEIWFEPEGWRAQYYDGDFTIGPVDGDSPQEVLSLALKYAQRYSLESF